MVTVSQLIVALVEIEKKHGDLPLVEELYYPGSREFAIVDDLPKLEVIEQTDKFGVSRLLFIE